MNFIERAFRWMAVDEGSTRPLALVRIGIAILLWSTFAERFILWRGLPGGLGPHTVPLEATTMVVCGLIFYVSSTTMLIGLYSRISCLVCGLNQIVFMSILQHSFGQRSWVLHSTQLMMLATLILAISPSGRSFSVDRWRALRRGDALPERGLLMGSRLIAVMMCSMYFWATVGKLRPGFLSGDELERFYLWYYADSDYPLWAGFNALAIALSWATVALEGALTIGLWHRRWRPWLVVLGSAFHVLLYTTLEVYTFTTACMLLYICYFDADAVHRAIDKLLGRDGAGDPSST